MEKSLATVIVKKYITLRPTFVVWEPVHQQMQKILIEFFLIN
jgi:hypothetical protein